MAITDYDKVKLLLPMSGSNNGTSFPDYSVLNTTLTATGNTKTSTTQSKFYGSSGYFDGSGDYINLPDTVQVNGTEDFVLEAWVYVTDFSSIPSIYSQYTSNSIGFNLYFLGNGKLELWTAANGNATTTTTNSASINTWTHIALQRVSNVWKLFINGVEGASITLTMSLTPSTNYGKIGYVYYGNGWYYLGYMQDFCIRTGAITAYTTGFTPPGSFIGTISGNVKDSSNANAVRNIIAFPRSLTTRMFTTTSDASGNYSITLPTAECCRVVLDSATADPIFNDLIDRVIPQ